jgi:glycosyltransferase involved in cell wall biosynthesis
MKISIITVTYNSAATVEATLASVAAQDHNDIEHIIVDGKSTDNTLEVVEKYRHRISKVISEKDDGIYYALNKGISLATGDVVGIIHSDDFYVHGKVLSKVADTFGKGVDSVYADLQYVNRDNTDKVVRHWRSGKYRDGIFLSGWMPPHPTFFIKRWCYEKHGSFNTALKSAADYELMLRMLHKHKISTAYIPEVLVKMRVGGKSNASLMNRINANREDRLAWKLNGLEPGLLTLAFKPLSKIRQFLGV